MKNRYNDLSTYLKTKFHEKTFKVPLNGSFSCPNRDGTISTKGCLFCSEQGSGEFAGNLNDSLAQQFTKVKTVLHKKWPKAKYIVYFQAFSNTYGPIEKLKSLFDEAILLDENIVAISIATRCDCLNDEVLTYLCELNKKIPVWIELGLQTAKESTMKLLNLGYTKAQFTTAVTQLNKRNITIIAHIINGLPYETKKDMLDTIHFLNELPINGIKIHNLVLIKNTPLAQMYDEFHFSMLSFEEYIEIVCEQLTILKPDIVVHRLSADTKKEHVIEPKWSLNKKVILNEISKRLNEKNDFQGCHDREKKPDLH